jgi:hypothetical protein
MSPDKVKNAVYFEPGMTLSGFAEEALTSWLKGLERKRGQPYPPRKENKLRPGRPFE